MFLSMMEHYIWVLWMVIPATSEVLLRDAPIPVCDCELAKGSPHNLSCDKEGYFLTGYTNQDGQIPVGPGYCCRGCVPEIKIVGQAAISFVWESCQQASTQVACANSRFITAFIHHHTTTQHLYYPTSGAVCCRPGLLLESGQIWQIQECNCKSREDVMCNASMGEFLTGFPQNEFPTAPVTCCEMCLGTHVVDVADCMIHQQCSSHGDCVLGSCVCNEGWSGASCDYRSNSNTSEGISLGLLPVLIIACVMASICMFTCIKRVAMYSRQLYQNWHFCQDQSLGANIQLQQVPREGSVGSDDTQLNQQESSPPIPTSSLLAYFANLGQVFNGSSRRQATSSTSLTQQLLQQQQQWFNESEEDVFNQNQASTEEHINLDGEVNCSLCFERRVQVALVPCGHSNLCRKCSRKLEQCPFCRRHISRRQRIYFTK